ncbi:MAG TPA: hypothetical protein VNL16_18700 [Chloroflexota bacterium]|nr:hypothetical protein [Chloroflexota bacterium]
MQQAGLVPTLYDYSRDHQWVRLMGWTDDELRSVPIHFQATSAGDYLNLANLGNTALGVSSEAGGGTSADTRALQNAYVYQSEAPPRLYQQLQRLIEQETPVADAVETFGRTPINREVGQEPPRRPAAPTGKQPAAQDQPPAKNQPR